MDQAFMKYLGTYSGRDLLAHHGLNEEGVWQVFGGDANCDLGGSHHRPHLGTFEGKLEDVIAHAANLSDFWQWGAGGTITKMATPIKISSITSARRLKLESDLRAAEQQVRDIQDLIDAEFGSR